MKERKGRTFTSSFGAGRREGHDASDFYARFPPPELSSETTLEPLRRLQQGEDACIVGDSRHMCLPNGKPLPAGSVALVVTSPPYFSGKEYEQALGAGGIPRSYAEYLSMLREVFNECKRVLEPGGRVAVNVANLGRKPYRSLSSDVIRILQDDLGLLLRGEVIWKKGEGASGSCAWGSFRSAANPVLRDLTERVVLASKGRFDRAQNLRQRQAFLLPYESDLSADEFMAATLDVWELSPESAKRVNHPAPFPVELPLRLIRLYTYRGDLVVDPFMGSGTALVAAARAGRRYLGYDTDESYVVIARERLRDELESARAKRGRRARQRPGSAASELYNEPRTAKALAGEMLASAGFRISKESARMAGLGATADFVAEDAGKRPWYFEVPAAFTTAKSGLARTEAVWQALGKAAVMSSNGRRPFVLLTSELPRPGSEGDLALRGAGPGIVFDVIDIASEAQCSRLKLYAEGGRCGGPELGFWSAKDLGH
ncbi:MAG TPA: site-specific DNA-methyltransferase [Acidimicrobiales bacterium]|nr:site-specific DNA-methyltransferase [Acidimicrobiales bacterium]